MHVGDRLRQRLGEIKRGEHVPEQDGRRDDGQDHHGFAHRIAQNQPDLFRLPKAIDQNRQKET